MSNAAYYSIETISPYVGRPVLRCVSAMEILSLWSKAEKDTETFNLLLSEKYGVTIRFEDVEEWGVSDLPCMVRDAQQGITRNKY